MRSVGIAVMRTDRRFDSGSEEELTESRCGSSQGNYKDMGGPWRANSSQGLLGRSNPSLQPTFPPSRSAVFSFRERHTAKHAKSQTDRRKGSQVDDQARRGSAIGC